ncbi:unnamed protein product [Lepidochelys kempii]
MLCQSVRNAPQWAPLHPWDWPENLWQRIHMDFAGPLEGSMFLVVVDAHSKWPEVSIMQSTTAESTIQKLRGLFSRFGLPEQLLSDNRPQFVSQAFQNVMKANGVHHITSAPHHPSTNGLAERFVQTMKQALKSARGQLSIQKHLDTFLLSYRNTPHATTKASPAFLMIGRQLRTFFDLLKPSEPRQIVQRQQQEQVIRHAPRAKDRTFSLGLPVLARNYTSGAKWVPATVITQTGPVSYTVWTAEDLTWRRHVDQLLPGHTSPQDTSSVELPDFTTSNETPNQKSPVPDFSPLLLPMAEVPLCLA